MIAGSERRVTIINRSFGRLIGKLSQEEEEEEGASFLLPLLPYTIDGEVSFLRPRGKGGIYINIYAGVQHPKVVFR